MKGIMDRKIYTRSLVSFLTLFGFIVMSLTGVVLFIMPEGRVAYWILWEWIWLSKTDWGNIHVLSSVLFIVAGIFHIYFNWKPLLNYFKDKAHKVARVRKELIISLLLCLVIIVGAIRPFPPLSYILEFEDWLKNTWVEEDDYEPPFGHAEMMPFRTFCIKMDIDPETASLELRSRGIQFDTGREILEEIARNNNLSPMDIYLLIKKFEPAPEKQITYTPESVEVEFSGTGIGNRSIRAICEKLGLDPETVSARLKKADLSENMEDTLKSIAESADSQPIEILKIILIDGYELPKSSK